MQGEKSTEISGALSCAGRTKEERLRQRKNCAAIDKDRASPSNDNFLITVRFFGSFPLLFTVWFAVTKEVIQMDKDSLAHSNHKRIHLCLCFYVSEW